MSSQPSLSKSKKAKPLPLASTISRLCSKPPQTLGRVRPDSRATSTNLTDPAEELESALASRTGELLHLQRGVLRASINDALRATREEPRKRRRGICMFYRLGIFGKFRGTIPVPSFTVIILSIGGSVNLSTCPLGQVMTSDSMWVRLPRPK